MALSVLPLDLSSWDESGRDCLVLPVFKDDRRVLFGDQRLDVTLEHAAADVTRSGCAVDRELGVLAHIDEMETLAAVEPGADVGDAALLDPRAGIHHQGEEARTVLHARKIVYIWPGARRARSV